MSKFLTDGTCIPSYLGTSTMGYPESMGEFNTISLMMGEVKRLVHPSDPRSLSKKVIEYHVQVQYRRGSEAAASVDFTCVITNLFGGVADHFTYTLRADDKKNQVDEVFGIGAKVLLLCLNGESRRAYIVGGVRDDTDKADAKADGHNLDFAFNGVEAKINDEGELTLKFRGKTKADGSLHDDADKEAEGAQIQMDKTGSIKVQTKDAKQYLHIDHANKKFDFLVDEKWTAKVNGEARFETGKNYEFAVGSQLKMEAQSTVLLRSAMAGLDISAALNVTVKSAGLLVGAATDSMIKGTTYRMQESVMNGKLAGFITALSAQVSAAGAGLNAASGFHKVPIAGPILGSVPLQAAAVAINAMAPILANMTAAITAFEAQAATYLSLVNKND